jgi:rod shape-determining protein MreD
MRWLTYFILAYLAMGLQLGLAPFLRYQGAEPSFVLLAVCFIAINAPRDAALLACFVLGAIQDLVTLEPLGLYALAYALVGMFVVSTQEIVYREHPLTHFSVALVGGLMTGTLVLIHGLVQKPMASPMVIFTGSLYTAILAPVILGILQKTKRLFAFQPTRRKPKAF